jgi:hypothetical protein
VAKENAPGGKLAVWLTEKGFALGSADGSVSMPQSERIGLAATVGRTVLMRYQGIRQLACVLESLTLDVPPDATSMNIDVSGRGRARGHGTVNFVGRRAAVGTVSFAGASSITVKGQP